MSRLCETFHAHLQSNLSSVPFDELELRIIANVTTAEVLDAMAELVKQGRARVEGDGWCYAEPKGREQKELWA